MKYLRWQMSNVLEINKFCTKASLFDFRRLIGKIQSRIFSEKIQDLFICEHAGATSTIRSELPNYMYHVNSTILHIQ